MSYDTDFSGKCQAVFFLTEAVGSQSSTPWERYVIGKQHHVPISVKGYIYTFASYLNTVGTFGYKPYRIAEI